MSNCSCVCLCPFASVRCCECSGSLSHWYYEKDGRLFCKKDYWAKFGELCHGCNDPITTGLIMVRGSIRWISLLITSLVLCLVLNLKLHPRTTTLVGRTNTCRHPYIYSLAGCTDTQPCMWDRCQTGNWPWFPYQLRQIVLQTTSERWSCCCCCDSGEQRGSE